MGGNQHIHRAYGRPCLLQIRANSFYDSCVSKASVLSFAFL